MASEAFFQRVSNFYFAPVGEEDLETVAHIKIGQVIKCAFTRPRNLKFFKKWWKMIEYAFDHWEPGELADPRLKGVVPEKNKNRFRKDVTIQAGHYEAFYRLDGAVTVEAKSISFGKMKEEDFEKFYSSCVNVILKKILTNYTREDLDEVVEKLLLGFA